jgi:hypothetical protein
MTIPRIADVEQFGSLVKGLAGGIIPGLPHGGDLLKVLDLIDIRMTAGNNEGYKRKRRRRCFREEYGRHMPFQMVHSDEGNRPGIGNRLCRGKADEKGPHQPGTARDSDALDVLHSHTGIIEGLQDNGADCFNMLPRGHLRNNAAIFAVNLDLRGDHVGEENPSVPDNSRGCLITR